VAISRYNLQLGGRLPLHDAVIYPRGAIVNGNQNNVAQVTVHNGHDFSVNDKFYYALSRSNIYKQRVFSVGSNGFSSTTLRFTPPQSTTTRFSFPDGALLVPLGADTGCTQNPDGSWSDPNFDGSSVAVYADPNGDSQYLNATVPIEPGGDLGFWCSVPDIWVLARDSRQNIQRIYICSQVGGSGGGGTSISVNANTSVPGDDTAPSFMIVRNNGVGDQIYIWARDSAGVSHWELITSIA